MACPKCKQVEDLSIPEIALKYTASTDRVIGRDGETYLITKCLVSPGLRPRSGWSAVIEVNGQVLTVNGQSPSDTASAVRKLLATNNFRISNLNLWFNLNIQWVGRTLEKNQNVKLQSLLDIANP